MSRSNLVYVAIAAILAFGFLPTEAGRLKRSPCKGLYGGYGGAGGFGGGYRGYGGGYGPYDGNGLYRGFDANTYGYQLGGNGGYAGAPAGPYN